MATVLPVAGQQDGSYLTMWSSAGLQCAPFTMNPCSALDLLLPSLCSSRHPSLSPGSPAECLTALIAIASGTPANVLLSTLVSP